jgi:hypothetical protein
MSKRYATFDANALGTSLAVDAGGAQLTTLSAGLSNARTALGTIALSVEDGFAEMIVFGDGTETGKIRCGFALGDVSLTVALGEDDSGIGYALTEGKIRSDAADTATVTAGASGDVIGLRYYAATDSVAVYRNGALIHSQTLPSGWIDEPIYFAASLGSDAAAGDLKIQVNAGRDAFEHAPDNAVSGWWSAISICSAYRFSDVDYVSLPTDATPNTRWIGNITNADIITDRGVTFWTWGGSNSRGSSVSINVSDQDSTLDDALGGLYRDQTVTVQRVASEYGSHDAATTTGRYVVERIEVQDELTRRIVCRDPLAKLETPLQRRKIRPDAAEEAAGRPWPTTIGACYSVEPVLIDETDYVFAVDSVGCQQIGKVRDKGDPLIPSTDYTINDGGQTITLDAPNVGIVTMDAAATGLEYAPPAATDILGGDGDPFDSGAWTLATSSGTAPSISGGVLTFAQETGVVATAVHAATVSSGGLYRITVDVAQIELDMPSGVAAELLLCRTSSQFSAFQRIRAAGVQTFFYAAPFSHQVWLVYAANSIAGGDDCNVASIVVESIPNIDETGDDDEVENSLEPMSLADLLTELVQNRGGLEATDWQATDAESIDTASGYAGQGYHSRDQVTIRKAVDDVLTGYTASIYLDRSGKLRVMRLVAPEDETGVSSLTDDDMLTPPLPEWDDGAGLTRSLGARRNERVLTDSDLVTDDLDVTIRLRRKLAREHRYICVTGTPLAPGYEHADVADPIGTRLVVRADGQAEIDRICGIYAKSRAFYRCKVAGRSDIEVGDVLTVHYPRFGLAAGRKLLVVRIRESTMQDTQELTLWGLSPEEP